MAEHAQGGGNKRYYTPFKGTFRRRVNEPGENTETRENKNGKVVHEIVLGAVSGRLLSLEAEKGDYGVQLKYLMQDEDGSFEVQLPITSDYARDLNNRLLNIAPKTIAEREIKISIFDYAREDGNKSGFCVPYVNMGQGWDNAVKIERKFTKENPGNMPAWEQAEDPKTGEVVWSQLKQNNFLAQHVRALLEDAQQVLPERPMQQSIVPAPQASTGNKNSISTAQIDMSTFGDDDDLPF